MSRLDELDVVLSRRNGKIVAAIPALRIYATADDTASALAALEAKKNAYRSDLEEAGLADAFETSGFSETAPKADVRSGDLRVFALKAGIVVGFVAIVMLLVGGLVAAKIDETIFRTGYAIRTTLLPLNVGGPEFWSRVESQLERATAMVDRMSLEEQQKMLTSVRTVVSRVRPFAAELAPLLSAMRLEVDQTPAQTCK